MSRINNQDGIVFDALSAGPIEGLVDGSKSVYLNGAPFTKLSAVGEEYTGGLTITANAVAGNDFIQVPNSKVVEFAGVDFASNDYYIWIEGAGQKFTSTSISSPFGSTFYNNKFDRLMIDNVPRKYCYDLSKLSQTDAGLHQNSTSPILQTFVLEETSERGYFTQIVDRVMSFKSQSLYRTVYPANDALGTFMSTEGLTTFDEVGVRPTYSRGDRGSPVLQNSLNMQFDYVAKITGITDQNNGTSRVTFSTGSTSSKEPSPIGTSVTNAITKVVFANSVSQNFLGDSEFRTGERNQPPMKIGADEAAATTSIHVQPNVSLEWSKLTGGTAGATIVNSSGTSGFTLGLQPSQFKNINSLVCTFSWPNGQFRADQNGDHGSALTEIQVTLFYRNAPTEPYQSAQLLGREVLAREATENRGAADILIAKDFVTPVADEWKNRGFGNKRR